MLDSIPDGDEMKSLLGESLYDVWTQLTACIDETYDMDGHGTKAARHGNMSTNIVGAARHCALCMPGKTVWDLWLSLEKRSEQSLKQTKMSMPKRFSRFMKNPRPIMMENG